MSWAKSLIKLSTYEVETLQKRLAEIMDRHSAAEFRLALMEAEAEAEAERANESADAGWYHIGFLDGLRIRRTMALAEIAAIAAEAKGARDALAQAFEEQKKYEQIAEQARVMEVREAGRREVAALDELGLRKVANR